MKESNFQIEKYFDNIELISFLLLSTFYKENIHVNSLNMKFLSF